MKKIFYLIIAVIYFTSCTKDYNVTITGVNFHPNKLYENFSVETEFLDSELIFGADFSMNPDHGHGSGSIFGPRVGDINYINPVLEDRFVLTSNHDFLLENDTFKSGENLIDFFEYKMLKDMFRLSYNFRSTELFLNESGYYKFYFTAVLSDKSEVSDSCLVKINF
ncbi:MAG: hypothetical protein PHI52_04395 [Bacteroidales bacterium]|nr:hypothetical protein [Bacteroidales bacterium]